jgi:hypothetical protein
LTFEAANSVSLSKFREVLPQCGIIARLHGRTVGMMEPKERERCVRASLDGVRRRLTELGIECTPEAVEEAAQTSDDERELCRKRFNRRFEGAFRYFCREREG